jgi:ethanolamine utilization protein EutN
VKLARVVGTVVSTICSPIFEDRTLLLCDLVEPSGEAAGGYLIAVDTVGAGAGELVLILDEGTSARQIVGAAYGPLRTVIVGIVDAVEGPVAKAEPAAGPTAERETAAQRTKAAKTPARRTKRSSPQV